MTKLGLQMYTVRDAAAKDFAGTIREVGRIGYDGIEHGGAGPLGVPEFKALNASLKLDPFGAHTGLQGLQGEKLPETLAYYASLGTRFLAISDRRDDEAGWKACGAALNAAGRAAAAHGITMQYHNHAHELTQKFGGRCALDVLIAETDPAHVKFQLDVGWVTRAGEDPVVWLRKLEGRIRTIHVKDTTAPPDAQWTEVGNGILPLGLVHKAAQALGVEWYVVEQDTCARPPLESAAISYKKVRELLG